MMLQQPSQVAVADEAEELVAFYDGGHAESLARHLVDDFAHKGSGSDARNGIATMHQGCYASEALAELAAGMQSRSSKRSFCNGLF